MEPRRLSFMCPPRLFAAVSTAATAAELTLSEWARLALRDRLAAERREHEQAAGRNGGQ
jgi:hypothetical protein